ncbi:MAG: hypothetical protein ACYDBQ_04235 [Thermoplasmatota archaeon]
MRDWLSTALLGARRAAPYGVVMALMVAAALALGANLSNATPSAAHPHGWPGTASFEAGVASVRPELVLASTLAPLLLGTRAARSGWPRFLPRVGGEVAVLGVSMAVAGLVGTWAASSTARGSLSAFLAAHVGLALSFYALGALAGAATRRYAVPLALAGWGLFVVAWDDVVLWQLFRQAGYANLVAGRFPGWFYVAQAASPVSSYRATLILSVAGFRDWTEHAALDHAALPPGVNGATFALLQYTAWVAFPLLAGGVLLWAKSVWPLPWRTALPVPVEADD